MATAIKPMTPATIRRLMAEECAAPTLKAASRNERIALWTLSILTARGVIAPSDEAAS